MLSKGDLGVSYLIAVGIGVFGSLAAGIVLTTDVRELLVDPNTVLTVCAGFVVAGGFFLAGIKLYTSDLGGDRVWRVAQIGTAGLGVPTVIVVLLGVFAPDTLQGFEWRSVVMIVIAGGGVVGVLVGALGELQAEHHRTKRLHQRNAVFLRLLRHDVRTAANLILGHLSHLSNGTSTKTDSVEIVRNQVEHILRLSDTARKLDELDLKETTTAIDLGALVEDRVEVLEDTYPSVEVDTEIERSMYAQANELLSSVVDNVLWNGVEHNDGEPWLHVSVRHSDRHDGVELRVRDNGPGFPDHELSVHEGAAESDLLHSNGIGLWLARWIVDSYDGELSIKNHPDGGAVVTAVLPPAASNSARVEEHEQSDAPQVDPPAP